MFVLVIVTKLAIFPFNPNTIFAVFATKKLAATLGANIFELAVILLIATILLGFKLPVYVGR
jgi:hypothetical protein